MKRKSRKSIFYLFLLVMCLCVMSVPVHAAGRNVCSIGKKGYTTLEAALKAVKNGQTIKMNKKVSLVDSMNVVLNKDKKYTVDLAKHGYYITVKKGKVTFKNSGAGRIYVKKNASVTIKSGKYEELNVFGKNTSASVQGGYIYDIYNGDYRHKGGKLTVTNASGYSLFNYGTAVLNGVKFVNVHNYKNLTMKKGTITSACEVGEGTMNIEGKKNKVNINLLNSFANLNIKSGKISCKRILNHKKMKLSGGTVTLSERFEMGLNSQTIITGGKLSGPISDFDSKSLKISGGSVSGPIKCGNITVTGGTVGEVDFDEYGGKSRLKVTGGKVNLVKCLKSCLSYKPGCVKKVEYY